jgi:hypothetical protein
MTKEEMAEEYVKKNCDDSLYSFRGQELQEAFLAGYEAGKDEAEADLATVAYMQGGENMRKKIDSSLTEAKSLINRLSEYIVLSEDYWKKEDVEKQKEILREAEAFLKEKENDSNGTSQ